MSDVPTVIDFETVMKRIPPEVLEEPVNGQNPKPGTFADQLQGGPMLLVFLRYFG